MFWDISFLVPEHKGVVQKTKGQSNPAARIKFAAASESLETNQFISDTLLLRY